MNSISDTIRRLGIVPVIKIDDPDLAIPLAIALEAGGLPLAEVTFRTAAAAQAIRNIAAGCPQMMIGAGTVTTTEQVDVAVEAGASFMVSPGF
ncbi:MAG: keto-hydroxyglutarate-aldolase/keto-deoxy-phosphogluconate aldolase, partial [Eubacteriales bacterium]|nr:keto-hydroxyglutarate-aldolase/keto-deoxy-phosphogluconate aldolase [Eubacteriales bacterium]